MRLCKFILQSYCSSQKKFFNEVYHEEVHFTFEFYMLTCYFDAKFCFCGFQAFCTYSSRICSMIMRRVLGEAPPVNSNAAGNPEIYKKWQLPPVEDFLFVFPVNCLQVRVLNRSGASPGMIKLMLLLAL